MTISHNPFFVLGVSCRDSRRTIVSKADDLSFSLDADTCSEAQSVLLTPSKRLAAEVGWFCDLDDNETDAIRECIRQLKQIPIDRLNSLSRLNAAVYNFSIANFDNSFEIGNAILDIDGQFDNLDVEDILSMINVNHEQVGINAVTEAEVISELGKIRESIRQIVTNKLQSLNESEHVELVTMIADKCIADNNYYDGVVISDVIDQYEVWAQSRLDSKEEKIRSQIEAIKSSSKDSYIHNTVETIIQEIKEWDKYAQPLQLSITVKGLENWKFKTLATDVRDLAIYLNNEKHKVGLALKLTCALKEVFTELPEFLDLFTNDVATLTDLHEKQIEQIISQAQARSASQSTSASNKPTKSSSSGCLITFGILALILVINWIYLSISESSNSTTTEQPSSSISRSQTDNSNQITNEIDENFSSSSNAGYSTKAQQLERELDALKTDIDDMESDITSMVSDLDEYQSNYYSTGDEYYLTQYNDLVEEYNELYEEYTDAIDDYNAKADEYNKLIGAN